MLEGIAALLKCSYIFWDTWQELDDSTLISGTTLNTRNRSPKSTFARWKTIHWNYTVYFNHCGFSIWYYTVLQLLMKDVVFYPSWKFCYVLWTAYQLCVNTIVENHSIMELQMLIHSDWDIRCRNLRLKIKTVKVVLVAPSWVDCIGRELGYRSTSDSAWAYKLQFTGWPIVWLIKLDWCRPWIFGEMGENNPSCLVQTSFM